MAATLTRHHQHILGQIADAGGHCDLDMYGRLTSPQTRAPLAADGPAVLVLVAHGLVAGEGGLILLTEAGRAAVTAHRMGQVREAIGG